VNKEFILQRIKPYLNDQGMLGEEDFNKLFHKLNKRLQYKVIDILIDHDIEIDYINRSKKRRTQNGEGKETGKVYAEGLNKLTNEQLCIMYQQGYSQALDFRDTYLKKMIMLVLPLIIGSSAYQINQVVERTIASQIAVGGITTLSYAQKLVSFIKDIFVLSIVTVLYPNISRMAAGSHMISFKKTVSDAAVGICLLMIPSTIGVMIFSKPIIELLFRRGAFDANAVSMTSEALFFYSLGMTALGIRSVLVKAFYSLKDVKTPVKNSAISIVSNILLNVLLAKSFGIAGLALASSISGGLAVSLLHFSLKNKIGPMDIKSFAASLLKIILISLGMGLAAKLFFEILKTILNQNLSLLLSVFLGAAFYLAGISYSKIAMVDTMRELLAAKIKSLSRLNT
jgi:putative peptidoglycan lipid II flippase